jgi:hypothetical protein
MVGRAKATWFLSCSNVDRMKRLIAAPLGSGLFGTSREATQRSAGDKPVKPAFGPDLPGQAGHALVTQACRWPQKAREADR